MTLFPDSSLTDFEKATPARDSCPMRFGMDNRQAEGLTLELRRTEIAVRDSWIGWTADQYVENLRNNASERHVRWLVRLVNEGINEIYLDDLLDPSQRLVTRRILIQTQ